MPVTIKKRWGHSEQVLTWFMWKALWFAQSLLRIRGSDTCSADGTHHAGQSVIILGPDAHRVRPGIAAPIRLEVRCLSLCHAALPQPSTVKLLISPSDTWDLRPGVLVSPMPILAPSRRALGAFSYSLYGLHQERGFLTPHKPTSRNNLPG